MFVTDFKSKRDWEKFLEYLEAQKIEKDKKLKKNC